GCDRDDRDPASGRDLRSVASGAADASPPQGGGGVDRHPHHQARGLNQTPTSIPDCSRVRIARLTAETIAFSDAVEMSPSMPTPHRRSPSTSSSTYDAACASPPALRVCST